MGRYARILRSMMRRVSPATRATVATTPKTTTAQKALANRWLQTLRFAAYCAVLTLAGTGIVSADIYSVPAQRAADWLVLQRNLVDGSWASAEDLRFIQTAEAVTALAALNRRTPEYYAGLVWLQNHQADNADFIARRIPVLRVNGNSVDSDLLELQATQSLAAPGNGGFGLSKAYQGAALDTALALQSYAQAGVTSGTASAINFLKSSQLTGTDKGWALGQETVSDPVTTAHVLIALIAYRASDATLTTPIANGLAALSAKVGTGAPVIQRALAVLANLRNQSTSTQAAALLNSLLLNQAPDGSWGDDLYATALVMRALGAAMASDLAAQQQLLNIPDAQLRSAVNKSLGRNALDALNVGELGKLTSLDISNLNISNLTGLQYATHLTYLNASNNNITDFSPVSALASATIIKDGNPGYIPPVASSGDTDVPTLPEWGAILFASLLMWSAARHNQAKRL